MKDILLTPDEAAAIQNKRNESYFAEALLNTFTEETHTFYRACREVIENMEVALEEANPSLTDNNNDLITNNGLELWVDDSSAYYAEQQVAFSLMTDVLLHMPEVRAEITRLYSAEEVQAECMALAECLLYVIEEQIINSQIYMLENQ